MTADDWVFVFVIFAILGAVLVFDWWVRSRERD
jgi:hypothetical protein